jgi:outer membrane protein TolC
MAYSNPLARWLLVAAGLVVSASVASAQPAPSPGTVRRLSVDEAVTLALEQNLGIQIERVNPRIQDVEIAQTRAAWAPNFSTILQNNSTDVPVTNAFAGGQSVVTNSRFTVDFGVNQRLPTGANYAVGWNSYRNETSSFFDTFNPQIRSALSFNATQPLLRNFRIDSIRQQLALNEKARQNADVELQATITRTSRNVRNAYWDLSYAINNLAAQRQSLELAQRLLRDNERRVQIGTMAPIDIVEAQSEVARNDEAVIVAEAAISQAEDRLRALILDPSDPDFWTARLEPSDDAPYQALAVDVDAAVRRALQSRSDIAQARNNLEQNDISIRFLRNQILPEVNAQANYGIVGIGGVRLEQLNLATLPTDGSVPARTVLSERSFAAALRDVFTNAFPQWTFGVEIAYPIGTSTSEANLARARLQHSQAQTQLRNLELQVVTQVRDAARQVQTNQKRVESARAARELAERRLEAEEKKFAAGIQTSFFVFQAQRDLSQARTNEVRAVNDYNKSLVDFEAVQDVPLGAGTQVGTVNIGGGAAPLTR